ncbi:MAG TPA: hypothetical protein VFG83_02730, partial [Kofleriaceae bacterium]|nr:hypothetical protein [Kofleriaceae bacterium]
MNRQIFSLVVIAVVALPLSSARADDPEVERVLAHFDNEPSVREVQKAAIEYYNVSPDTISSLRSRTRSKALVPGLTVGVTNSLAGFTRNVDDIIFRASGDYAIIENQEADFLGLTASATWQLDRLVFNAEELDVMALIGIQDGIQREVTSLYYIRRRLQIELLLNPPTTVQSRISGQLRLEELTGLLDAYTGGYFSRAVEKNRRRESALSRSANPVASATRTVAPRTAPATELPASLIDPAHLS